MRVRRCGLYWVGWAILALGMLSGCGEVSPSPLSPQVAYPHIRGVVRFGGAIPRRKPLVVAGDIYCESCSQKKPLLSEAWVVDPNSRGVQNAFVWIKAGVLAVDYEPGAPVAMEVTGCRYEPHVLGVQVGDRVRFVGKDSTLHNLHLVSQMSYAENHSLPLDRVIEIQFKRPMVPLAVKCDIHSWMRGYLCVVDNPFFAVTGSDGSFDLGALPPGAYTVGLWHESAPSQEQTITVKAGEPVMLTFILQVEE